MADKYANKARAARQCWAKERCRQKRAFLNEQTARLHNRGQRPYRCPHCGNWHLASYKVMRAICTSHRVNRRYG